jgi:non-ribosomal peptide synthetase component F
MITDRQETGQRKRSDSDTVDHHDLQSHVQVDEFRQFTKEEIEQSIPVRFEKIVRLYPDRVAVKVRNQVVTYSQLNAMANRVGHSIVAQRGTEPEPVGLLFEKGVPLMAAMLGVLKTGKFFVLLDRSFPKARIATVLKDSQATFVVTDQQDVSFTEQVAGGGCDVIELINQSTSSDDLTLPISPKAFALIYHTSGSAGRPKSVVQTHQNILHDVMLRANAYHVCQHDRLCLLSSGTASTVLNVFLALLDGAALLPFDTKKEGVIRLVSWLSEEKISICWISSPLFRKLAEAITGSEEFPDLRLIRLASEGVYKVDVDLYKKVFPAKCMLANGLSSSESGLLRTYLIDHKTEIAGNDVPVGYPVEDNELLLLDDEGNEVGFNQVGESLSGVNSCPLAIGIDSTSPKPSSSPTQKAVRSDFIIRETWVSCFLTVALSTRGERIFASRFAVTGSTSRRSKRSCVTLRQ